ncbi:MoaA/NifB/PqqE/SkfB family radical SAM enzyme [Vibrio crassostreae]|uniref:radical SAM protein n=1 Tax=Vibrio crassostreae TaxID=246167 RepID=UPI001053C5DE|nr:radical SAM protein [Vibrio crassostreae]TCN90359.1 MoaA/NifB/PqqE/SkfB family radical SAM enzyme [Vibrio crassostreae]CAK2550712.1 MoaA/NifB/PqqE/SkfB family radical SAM enzyme [Vibrio crassostreae]CAK4019373.1 MoaA/NifB/PqqE/SkfB family radical SAM enzyme [Vibrio crassostreae]
MSNNKYLYKTRVRKGFFINWALMNACNYQCGYCHSDLNGGTIKAPSYQVVLGFVKHLFDYIEDCNDKPCFEFGGGEVTLLGYFSDLIKHISSLSGEVTIVSNDSKKLSWWQDNSKYLSGVSLSYHINDIKSESHFIEVSKVLESSRTTRFHVNIMMVPDRFDDCLAFANSLKQEVRCSIALQPLFEGFGHGGITKKYPYTPEQEQIMKDFRGRPELKTLPPSMAELKVNYADGTTENMSTFDLIANDQTNFVGWDCYAGIDSLVITFSGDIYRSWCMQDGPIGSIYDENIELPTHPTKCKTKICQCGVDLSAKKVNTKLASNKQHEIAVTQL